MGSSIFDVGAGIALNDNFVKVVTWVTMNGATPIVLLTWPCICPSRIPHRTLDRCEAVFKSHLEAVLKSHLAFVSCFTLFFTRSAPYGVFSSAQTDRLNFGDEHKDRKKKK